MKKIVVLLGIVVFYTTAQGQYVSDALKYSQNFPAISARSLGMGGAFTSLGGDVSAALYNPAGLGLIPEIRNNVHPGTERHKHFSRLSG